jgi:ABC-2 type transport system permease protein
MALVLEFTAGALFPLDILPARVQAILAWMPSPYLVFFPLNILLEKLDSIQILKGFSIQILWIIGLALLARFVWRRGVKIYGAQGA